MADNRFLKLIIWSICALVVGISALALAGWIFDIQFLKGLRADWTSMRISTALGLTCCAAALFAAREDPLTRLRRVACSGLGVFVGLNGLTSLLAYFRPLLTENEEWRMAPLTAVIFMGFGAAFVFMASPSRRGAGIGHIIAVPLSLASFLVLVGYLFDVNSVHTWMQVPVALNTGIACCALSAGLFLVRTDTWFMRVLTSAGSGGAIARRLLPAAVAVPVLIGWLRVASERAGLMPAPVATAVAVIADSFVLLWILWLTARSANRADERYRNLVEMSPDALFVYRDGRIVQVNQAALGLVGAESPKQLIGKTPFDIFHPDYHAIIRERHGLLLSGQAVPLIEEKVVRLDGAIRDVEVAASPLSERQGLAAQVILRDITGRKLVEEALGRQREWLRVTLASIGDAVVATDNGASIAFLNPVAARLTGWSQEEALGRPAREVFRIINEKTGEPAEDIIERVLQEGRVFTLANHTALIARDGRRIPIEDSAAPIRDAAGNLAGAVLVFHDVSAKRRERNRLLQLNRTLRAHSRSDQALLHAAGEKSYLDEVCRIIVEDCGHAMVWIGFREFDENNTVRPAAYSGFEEGYLETLGITWANTERGRGPTGTAIRTGKVCICRNMLTDPAFLPWRERALRRGYASSIALPLMDGGQAFGALTVYSRESDPFSDEEVNLLTEIAGDLAYGLAVVRLRGAHAQAEHTLRESEERFRTLAESIPHSVWVTAPDGRLEYVNERFRAYRGLPDMECTDWRVWRDGVHPADLPACDAAWNKLLASGADVTFEYRLQRARDGAWRWQLGHGRAARAADGGTILLIGTSTDVHDQKLAEEAVRQSQKLESIGLLAGGIAHDFNNLLVGVIGNAGLAEDMLPPGSPVADVLRRIVESGEQAANLTRQMLAYAGKGRFIVEPVDLSALVGKASRLIQSSISKKISLDLWIPSGLPAVESDASQMQQVLMNLALNAAEAIGGISGVIAIATGEARLNGERAVFLEVRDTGSGMDAATKARIFDPFFTTKFTGRGLGLAAVAGIVRAHEGLIEVTTAPGAGSTFRVLFPAMAAAAAPEPAAPFQSDLEGHGTVLVVDDEEIVRNTAKLSLERRGYEVLVAENGPAAIDVVRSEGHRIGLVLLDLSMPGMSGEETLPRLRQLRPDLEVIVSSGFTEAEALRLFSGARVSGFLQKPYTVQELARKAKTVLA